MAPHSKNSNVHCGKKYCKKAQCISKLYLFRVFYRLSQIIHRNAMLLLIWSLMGGAVFISFLTIEFAVLLYVSIDIQDYSILNWISLFPITATRDTGGFWLCFVLYRNVSDIIFVVLFYIFGFVNFECGLDICPSYDVRYELASDTGMMTFGLLVYVSIMCLISCCYFFLLLVFNQGFEDSYTSGREIHAIVEYKQWNEMSDMLLYGTSVKLITQRTECLPILVHCHQTIFRYLKLDSVLHLWQHSDMINGYFNEKPHLFCQFIVRLYDNYPNDCGQLITTKENAPQVGLYIYWLARMYQYDGAGMIDQQDNEILVSKLYPLFKKEFAIDVRDTDNHILIDKDDANEERKDDSDGISVVIKADHENDVGATITMDSNMVASLFQAYHEIVNIGLQGGGQGQVGLGGGKVHIDMILRQIIDKACEQMNAVDEAFRSTWKVDRYLQFEAMYLRLAKGNILQFACYYLSSDLVEYFIKQIKNLDVLKELLFYSDDYGNNIFHYIVSRNVYNQNMEYTVRMTIESDTIKLLQLLIDIVREIDDYYYSVKHFWNQTNTVCINLYS